MSSSGLPSGHRYLRRLRLQRQSSLVVAFHLVQGEAPCIALVGHERLEDAERHRLPTADAVLQGTRHRGDVGEARALGEEAPHFEVRIDALRETPEHLEHQPLAVDHRGVALLGPHHLGREGNVLGSAELAEDPGPDRQEFARGAPQRAPPPDGLEERRAQLRILQSVEEKAGLGARRRRELQLGQHRLGPLASQGLRFRSGREAHRQGVGLRAGLLLLDLDQRDPSLGGSVPQRNRLQHARGPDLLRLSAEPAALAQDRRKRRPPGPPAPRPGTRSPSSHRTRSSGTREGATSRGAPSATSAVSRRNQ